MTPERPAAFPFAVDAWGAGKTLAFPTIEQSRRVLLDEVGAAPDLTLVKPIGNLGDELIWAGTRRLLERHIYREVDLEELSFASGELAVIAGGGAWSRRYNEILPEVLAIAEERFDRVIVFPSTFEVAEDRVRAALSGSRATFFARETESYCQINGICRARVSLDGAFFYDYSTLRGVRGAGQLNAFRTDDERLGEVVLPEDNDDISLTADSLDAWLETIAKVAVVNTDRAHVMIAAALMGKRVNYTSSSYFKIDALAESSLAEYDVHRLPKATNRRRAVKDAPSVRAQSARIPTPERVTIAIVGRDSQDSIRPLVSSIAESATPTSVFIHDRNSRPQTREILERVASQHPSIQFKLANRDLGVPAALRLAAADSRSEYVMFLDYEMWLAPGALDLMVETLVADPTTQAVAPTIVDSSGLVRSSGGWTVERARAVSIEHPGAGLTPDQLEDRSRETGWVPLRGSLIRRTALEAVPLAPLDDVPAQNADWCLRANAFNAGAFRTCPAAVVRDGRPPGLPTEPTIVSRRFAASALPAQAEFLRRHDRVLADRLACLVPELKNASGEIDTAAAALLLAYVEARGTNWTLLEWMNGGLEPLFAGIDAGNPEARARNRERTEWLEARNAMLTGIENGSWWKLRGRLEPLRKFAKRSHAASDGGQSK